MKTSIKAIILAASSIITAMSCQKETAVSKTQDQVNVGETIQISINASLGDLVSADGTKATAESVIRLKWEGTESNPEYVKAYCGSNLISTGDGLTVTPSDNKMFAKLTGEITTTGLTSGTSVITFVYSSGCTVEGLTFDLSNQTDDIPFVAYATLVYDGTATLTNKMVEFKFATSVMKIAATNLGGGTISTATISGINTKVTLTPQTSDETVTITGNTTGTITKTVGFDASSDGTRAIITVGLVPDDNKGRNITVKQASYTNKGVITSAAIESNTSYTTPTALFPCGTLGTGETAHDYVLIAGTKWATQNLAVSASGKTQWKSVCLPGTTTPVQIGDYFQWGAHEGYTTEENSDKGLLIYTAFTNNGSSDSFTWKTGLSAEFSTSSITPYYNSGYQKYTTGDGIVTLTPSDDVASILWSGTWRMPTSAECQALYEATYWKWDEIDKGYYVYAPQSGDAGKVNNGTGTYVKSSALLFFPAAGYGDGTTLDFAGSNGLYWSSSLSSSGPGYAYSLRFYSGTVNPQKSYGCYRGYSVRPVSD